MSEQPDEDCRNGTIPEIVASALVASAFKHLKELATSYLLLIREVARDEANRAMRRAAFVIAMLVFLGVGATLLGIGISRLLQTYVEFTGGGYIITGGSLLVISGLALLLWMRSHHR